MKTVTATGPTGSTVVPLVGKMNPFGHSLPPTKGNWKTHSNFVLRVTHGLPPLGPGRAAHWVSEVKEPTRGTLASSASYSQWTADCSGSFVTFCSLLLVVPGPIQPPS